MKITCIYKISSKIKNRIYIGSAIDYYSRIRIHKHQLLKNIHHSKKLQNHVNKYGFEDLQFTILENNIDVNDLIKKEQYYINEFKPYFNICKIAGNSYGVKRSKEFCIKLGELHKNNKYWVNKKHSEESKKKMSETHKKMVGELSPNFGRKFSKEHLAKLSSARKGRIVSEETRIKMRGGRNGGKKVYQFSLDNILIKEWENLRIVIESLGFKKSALLNNLNNISKNSYGYIWKYKVN